MEEPVLRQNQIHQMKNSGCNPDRQCGQECREEDGGV